MKYRGSEQGDKIAGNLNRFNATNDVMDGHEMEIVDNPDFPPFVHLVIALERVIRALSGDSAIGLRRTQ
ncbi:MAG: hypothetical protein R6T90_05320 [Dissulfuribacterales bacterium]